MDDQLRVAIAAIGKKGSHKTTILNKLEKVLKQEGFKLEIRNKPNEYSDQEASTWGKVK